MKMKPTVSNIVIAIFSATFVIIGLLTEITGWVIGGIYLWLQACTEIEA